MFFQQESDEIRYKSFWLDQMFIGNEAKIYEELYPMFFQQESDINVYKDKEWNGNEKLYGLFFSSQFRYPVLR